MYNPFQAFPVTGTWQQHASYSAGGVDYPLPYGTALAAPAAGTLRTAGGSGEWACGWVGSAGRRSILTLDTPLKRVQVQQPRPTEGEGDLVAIVFQHQSRFGTARHYGQGETLGWSGASANGQDWGGDAHLHWHGLTAEGKRVRVESFIGAPAPQPDPPTPRPQRKKKEEAVYGFIRHPNGTIALINGGNRTYSLLTYGEWLAYFTAGEKYADVSAGDFDATIAKLKAA